MSPIDPAPGQPIGGERQIARRVSAVAASDGADVRLHRVIGTAEIGEVDPFLMLDEVRTADPEAYAGGFPEHPHRGFETITYLLAGRLRHRDSHGHEGVLQAGDAQWMTAARGIVHSETPEQNEGLLHGFQLWLNLPASEKMLDPVWRDIPAADIPAVIFKTAEVKVLAGRYHGLKGPIASPTTQPFIADVLLKPEADISLPIPEDHQGFVYVFEGGIAIGQTLINPGQAGVLDEGGANLTLTAGGTEARALVITGRPLNEPVVRDGPFVMNTEDEIRQAFTDYQAGLF